MKKRSIKTTLRKSAAILLCAAQIAALSLVLNMGAVGYIVLPPAVLFKGQPISNGMRINVSSELVVRYQFTATAEELQNGLLSANLPANLKPSGTGTSNVSIDAVGDTSDLLPGILTVDEYCNLSIDFTSQISAQAEDDEDAEPGPGPDEDDTDGDGASDDDATTDGTTTDGTATDGATPGDTATGDTTTDGTTTDGAATGDTATDGTAPDSTPPDGSGAVLGTHISLPSGMPVPLDDFSSPFASSEYTVAFDIPCLLDVNPAGSELPVTISSGGQDFTVIATDTSFQYFADVVTIFGNHLYISKPGTVDPKFPFLNDYELLANHDMVYLTSDLMLVYFFKMDHSQLSHVYDMIATGSGTEYLVDFVLPVGLDIDAPTSWPIVLDIGGGSALEFGSLNVDISGNVSVSFKGSFWTEDNIMNVFDSVDDAYIYVNCMLTDYNDDSEKDRVIEFNDKISDDLTIRIGDNTHPHVLTKTGGSYDHVTGKFTWNVSFMPGDEPPIAWPVTFTDTFSADHTYDNDFVISNAAVTNFAESADGQTISFEIDDDDITDMTKPITFTYSTTLTDATIRHNVTTTATNTVTVTDYNDVPLGTAEDEVEVLPSEMSFITKTQGNVTENSSGRLATIDWTVTIFTENRNIAELILHDNLPSGLTLLPDSIVVNGTTINSDGAGGYSGDTGTTLYTLDPTANGDTYNNEGTTPCTFEISFTEPSGGYEDVYEITYTTIVAPSYYENISSATAGASAEAILKNIAWLTFEWGELGGPGPGIADLYATPYVTKDAAAPNNAIAKSSSYNTSTHTITWTITVNQYKTDILSADITDTIGTAAGQNQVYVPGSLEVLSPAAGAVPPTDISTTEDGDGNLKTLTFKTGNIGANTYTYTFKTIVTNKDHYAYNNAAVTYRNDVRIDGVVNDGKGSTFTDNAFATVSVSNKVLFKGNSSGSSTTNTTYDYNTHKITWTVIVNKNGIEMPDAVLVDSLAKGLTYVENSLKINGSDPPAGTSADISAADANGKTTLTIDLGDTAHNAMAKVTFEVLVDPDVYPNFKTSASFSIRNDIILQRSGFKDLSTYGNASVKNGVVEKKSDKTQIKPSTDEVIQYTVNVNPNGMNLEGAIPGTPLTLTDTIPAGLSLNIDSVVLSYASITGTGSSPKITAGTTIYDENTTSVNWLAYSNTKNANGTTSFTVTLPDMDKSYVLSYSCTVNDIVALANNGSTLRNTIELKGSGLTGTIISGSTETSILAGGGSGTAIAITQAKLEILKADAKRPPLALPGVSFELYAKLGSNYYYTGSGTTDSDGKLSFHPLSLGRTYYLREVGGIAGYTNPRDADGNLFPADGLPIVISKDDGGELIKYTITNDPATSSIVFIKRGSDDSYLSGAEFELSTDINTDGFTVNADGKYVISATSGTNGWVTFSDIPFGTYTLKEIAAPMYYTVNTTEFTVVIAEDGAYTITDDSGTPLDKDGEYHIIVDMVDPADPPPPPYTPPAGPPNVVVPTVIPDDPDNPIIPVTPAPADTPDNPSPSPSPTPNPSPSPSPNSPDTPDNPEPTDNPGTPEPPDNPDNPGTPDNPDYPDDLDNLDNPDNPEIPPSPQTMYVPPPPGITPHLAASTFIAQEDGTYIEFDEEGVPLGMWLQDDDGIWIFDEFPPLGALTLPQTGTGIPVSLPLSLLGIFLIAVGILLRRRLRVKE